MEMRELLLAAIDKAASDLHLTNGMPPVLRIDGALTPLDFPPLETDELRRLIYSVMSDTQKIQFEEEKELDFSISMTGLDRFRVNVHIQRGSTEAAFRRIPIYIPTMEELKLPPVLGSLARKINGLVLITGPTGMGKSTTMASMVQQINMERKCMIMSIEDPIEFLHVNRKSIIKQREVYRDTHSFAEALKRCLRQDPDVIVVGEMRDLETISTALTAAETGHLVLATLHTPDAAQTVERIVDVFPPYQQLQVRQQLASSLQGVVSQRLLPHVSGKGRVLACEIMVATPAIRNMIREQAVEQIPTALQTGAQFGMKPMDKSLRELLESGQIDLDTAVGNAKNVDEFRQFMRNSAVPPPNQNKFPR
ncbi:MAG: type IV pilus twitching motility protein PilT [Candidatus Omnitrophica bacterium]|nr:type IV pilus twitching motility protein PilT [Candidatus Omnitrophota bacterium]